MGQKRTPIDPMGWEKKKYVQVVEFVHDQFLHAFHGVVELGVGGVAPEIRFSHLGRDKLREKRFLRSTCKVTVITNIEEIVDDLDLIADGERPLCKVAQESIAKAKVSKPIKREKVALTISSTLQLAPHP